MSIYIVNFNDFEDYRAYTSVEKAKAILWENYEREVPEQVRAELTEQDRQTLDESLYIEDYGWVSEIDLYDENGKVVSF